MAGKGAAFTDTDRNATVHSVPLRQSPPAGKHPSAAGTGWIRWRLSVGVTSNHGNWFTAENANKELRVLAQSYDWLLFLTDAGLMAFVGDCLLRPQPRYAAIRAAFLASYNGKKSQNRFTKVRIDLSAAHALLDYFEENEKESDGWFEVISPARGHLGLLSEQIAGLLRH